MEVKIKKSLLFNMLKKTLNENRTNDNPGGNFIHPFDREESPIVPTTHMSTQLTVEEPPVSDPDYVPASIRELRTAAARISQEVPPDQVEFFYRSLHKLLDAALDKQTDDRMLSENVINLLHEQVNFYQQKIEQLANQYKEDPYFDIDAEVDEIMNNADTYGLDPSLVDPIEIQNDIISKAESSTDTGSIVTAPTPTTPSQSRAATQPPLSQPSDEDEGDLPDMTDDEADEMLGKISDSEIEREKPDNRGHRALSSDYWESKMDDLASGAQFPLSIVSQAIVDSMDAVSRIIGTQVAVSQYGYGGAGTDSEEGSSEAKAWSGVLSNNVNTNPEVIYKLPAKKKTKEFWQPIVTKFISRMQSGSAGSLTEFSDDFSTLAASAFEQYTKESGLPVTKFLGQVVTRVVDSILYDPNYGALTRNLAVDDAQLLSKLIDTGFSSQIKKDPFKIPTKSTFRARALNPEDTIEHAGEEKSLRQAIIDAVVAYTIVKSDEFKTKRRSLDADLDNEERDKAIQDIIVGLSGNDVFTYTEGAAKAKTSYEISKEEIIGQVSSYVDAKFEEAAQYAESRDSGEELTDDEILKYLEDEGVSEDEKKVVFTDAIAAQIMGDESSAASFRDYDYRVLSRKQKLAFQALENDTGNSEDVNYVNVYNDIMSELAPTAEEGIKQIKASKLDPEEIKELNKYATHFNEKQIKDLVDDIINAAASEEVGIPAVTRIVYGMPEKIDYEGQSDTVDRTPTRGGETLLQNISKEDLDFLVDSSASGPNIVRHIVGSIMGKTLRGGGLKKIADIDFDKANQAVAKKVVRSAVEIEKSLVKQLTSEFKGSDLKKAQDDAFATAVELGVKESKAKFLENNMRELQIKTIYPFVGRVKRLPDFDKMNPAAKNYVCWLSSIANERYDGAPTAQERIDTAREIFDKLKKAGDDMLGGKREEVKGLTTQVDNAINAALTSEIEGIKQYSDDMVKKLVRDKSLLRDVLIQAIGMHLQDVSR